MTARGAGTGNYGQAVPLHGGVVLDLARMDRIEAIQPDGVAVCEPGVRLGALENEARKAGWELRCYPSTIVKASVGGFLGGGSGGIGSVAHGGLRDFNTVRALEVVTMEAEPRVVRHEGEAVHEILHAWGTNGVITRIWLALTPAVEWSQCVVAFDSFDAAFDFSERIATDASLDQAPGHDLRVAHSVLLHAGATICAGGQGADLLPDCLRTTRGARVGGREQAAEKSPTPARTWACAPSRCSPTTPGTTPRCGRIKRIEAYTYLQCGFDPVTVREQMRRLKERFGQRNPLSHGVHEERRRGGSFPAPFRWSITPAKNG